MNLFVIIGVVIVLVALYFVPRMNILAWLAAWWLAIFVIFKWGIEPPLPTSILNMFMAIVTLSLLAYMSADSSHFATVRDKIGRFMTEDRYKIPLIIVVLLVPCLVALQVYFDISKDPTPPVAGRTIHPSPPSTIAFRGRTIDLVSDGNPYRILEVQNLDVFTGHVTNGRRIYYENCVFCHGDNLGGEGIFAHGFDPIPANFQDATTIGMLQEAYLFWRIAKGGPGLPSESTPWSSAMPAWEEFLTEEEIWDVIIFMYDFTGHRPRVRENVEGH